jgi:hypothetical protein
MSATTDQRPRRDEDRATGSGRPPRTASRAAPRTRVPRRRPGPRRVVAGSLALFLTLFSLLAWQMHNGGDPALGAGATSLAARRPAHVLVHRVVRRVVVVHAPAAASAAPPPAPPSAAAPAAPAAPAPAPAAPPPPPAPVVTRAS